MEASWQRGRRIYHQRVAHEPGVYRVGWRAQDGPRWFVQVRVRGHLEYWGTYRDQREAIAVARWVRRCRDAAPEVAAVPPIVTKRPAPAPVEQPRFDYLGR